LENRHGVQVNGENPADAKAAWKEIKSFGELAAWYLKEYATKRKRSWKEDRRILDKELLPAWRDRKASDVSRADVRALLRSVAERPAPVMANRVLALVSRIYNKALEDDIPGIVMNPALRLPKPGGEEQGRERVLSDAEIRELWVVLEEIKALKRRSSEDEYVAAISPMIARGLQVLLLMDSGLARSSGCDGPTWTSTRSGGPCLSRRPRTASRIVSHSPTGWWSC
jgi:hypothetical protein